MYRTELILGGAVLLFLAAGLLVAFEPKAEAEGAAADFSSGLFLATPLAVNVDDAVHWGNWGP